MKEVFKNFFLIVLGYFIFAVGAEIGARFKYDYIDQWKWKKAVDAYNDYIEKQNWGDEYGGKTPEETIEKVRQALLNEDIDLAVKYFTHPEYFKQSLLKIQQENGLISFAENDLGHIEESEKYDDLAYYDCVNEKRELTCRIMLIKFNNGLWKINDF